MLCMDPINNVGPGRSSALFIFFLKIIILLLFVTWCTLYERYTSIVKIYFFYFILAALRLFSVSDTCYHQHDMATTYQGGVSFSMSAQEDCVDGTTCNNANIDYFVPSCNSSLGKVVECDIPECGENILLLHT